MCYAIPGKVKEIGEKSVLVDYFGETRKAINEFYDVRIGDYVCAQGGFVIKKVSPSEAESTLSAWQELFFELKQIDLRLSRLDLKNKGIDKRLSSILDNALENKSLSLEDLLYLFNTESRSGIELIYKTANFLRQKYIKNSCCVHGIIEISNYCTQGCMYCGISTHNKALGRYRMTHKEIVDSALLAIEEFGFKAILLQSGEDAFYTADRLADIVAEIKAKAGVLICISFGEIGIDGLEKLYKAGARAILMRFETSNPKIYERLHPGRSLNTRLDHIKKAGQIGYLIMTGGLIGLPDQTREDIINDIYLAKELQAEMYSFGPFLPHPETPLASNSPPNEDDVLKALALTRLIDPEKSKILVTTAFETLCPDARRHGLLAGANSVMLNVTPIKYRKQYSIYPNRAYDKEEITTQIKETIALLQSLGRAPTDLGVN
ncbi:MAG: HypC/HybG/HupF family hydrogenase formation chaperone [Candidatus Omnitrophica bacterium]|nr:HypC/HybG/HupF family hydrogenase formation chaperone [Candidatus Omnitrophota bacterium]